MTCRTTPSSNRLPLILLVPIIEEQTESPKPCKSLSKHCVHCLFIVQRCAGTVARNNNSLSILRDLSQQHPAFSYCFNFDSLFCCIIKRNAFLKQSPSRISLLVFFNLPLVSFPSYCSFFLYFPFCKCFFGPKFSIHS